MQIVFSIRCLKTRLDRNVSLRLPLSEYEAGALMFWQNNPHI